MADIIEKKLRVIADYELLQSQKLHEEKKKGGEDGEERPGRTRINDDGGSSDEEADGGREADASEKRLHNRHE